MTYSDKTIPDRIRTARILRGHSQEALARLLGSHQEVVSRWESGKSVPQAEKLLRIAQSLRVSQLWLAFGQGPLEEGAPACSCEGPAVQP